MKNIFSIVLKIVEIVNPSGWICVSLCRVSSRLVTTPCILVSIDNWSLISIHDSFGIIIKKKLVMRLT